MKTTLRKNGSYLMVVPGPAVSSEYELAIRRNIEKTLEIDILFVIYVQGGNCIQFVESISENPAREQLKKTTMQCLGTSGENERCNRLTRNRNGLCPFHKHQLSKVRKQADLGVELAEE